MTESAVTATAVPLRRSLSAFARGDLGELRRDIRHSAPAKCARGGGWLGGRDSNPDTVVQSHVSYRWTTSQSGIEQLAAPKLSQYCLSEGGGLRRRSVPMTAREGG